MTYKGVREIPVKSRGLEGGVRNVLEWDLGAAGANGCILQQCRRHDGLTIVILLCYI